MFATSFRTCFVVGFILVLQRVATKAQFLIPSTACPQYFQYVTDGFRYAGKITLPTVPAGIVEVSVHLAQPGSSTSDHYGNITPYPDEQTVSRNVLNNQPAVMRVDFANPAISPKLTFLSLNGIELCADADYPPPRTLFKLSYQLSIYKKTPDSLQAANVPTSLIPIKFDAEPRPPKQPTNQLYAMLNIPTLQPTSTNTAKAPINLENICGREANIISGFVYGGADLVRGQFPWLTAVYKMDTDELSFKCSGSLISRRTVISAAHCFNGLRARQVALFFGRHDLQNYSEDGIVTRNVKQLIIHPDYETNTPNADIALLQIEPLESFTRYIQPICLWTEFVESTWIVGQSATVVGWGYERNADISQFPKIIDVDVVSKEDCLRSSAAFEQIVTDNTICAGNRDGSGPCMGDSGGGLMLLRNGRWVLRGIVSVGQSAQRRCNLYEYAVYCDTAKHMRWIRQHFLD